MIKRTLSRWSLRTLLLRSSSRFCRNGNRTLVLCLLEVEAQKQVRGILKRCAFTILVFSLPTFLRNKCECFPSYYFEQMEQAVTDSSINNRPEARALTQRMPETLKHHDQSLQNCLTLLRAIWQNEHTQVYQILRDLPWPETLQSLVTRYESMWKDCWV